LAPDPDNTGEGSFCRTVQFCIRIARRRSDLWQRGGNGGSPCLAVCRNLLVLSRPWPTHALLSLALAALFCSPCTIARPQGALFLSPGVWYGEET